MSKSRKNQGKHFSMRAKVHFFFSLNSSSKKEIKTEETGANIERKSRKSILFRGNNFDKKLSNGANNKNIQKLRFYEIMAYG